MHCPFCNNIQIELLDLKVTTTFTHLDFGDFAKNRQIARCPNCQLLSNYQALKESRQIDSLYRQPEYADSRQTAQTFIVSGESYPVTRSYLQAQIIQPYIENNTHPNILDIGCFDGKLLLELSRYFPKGQFSGFDINEKLQDFFPSKQNFHLWVSDPHKIRGKFDLICLSHSILYIADLSALFQLIRDRLKPNGLLFIQTPDVNLNPYQLLLADQYHYFSPTNLNNALNYFGFKTNFITCEWCPRDLVVLAKPDQAINERPFESDESIHHAIQVIHENRDRLKSLPQDIALSVLGTTVTAAFVDSILMHGNKCFVDENIDNVQGIFRGKPVVRPDALDKSIHLILPYGQSNQKIKNRFIEQYKLVDFVLL